MKKYKVIKGCAWKDFSCYGMEGKEIDESALVADGKPLPAEVLAVLLKKGNLIEVTQ